MVLGNSLLIPVLPAVQKALNISNVQVSLIITLFSVPAGIVIPLAGFLSDRFGRKKVIIPSLVLYGLGGVVAALAAFFLKEKAFAVILAGRVIQGIGAAGTAPIAMALCGDLWQGKQRAKSLGVIEASNGMGKVISPVLGAVLGTILWYAAFVFFPAIVIPVVLAMWILVKEPKQQREPPLLKEYARTIKQIFKNKSPLLLSCFFAGATALFLLFGVLFFLSDYLEKVLVLNGVIKGLALAVPVLFMSTTSYITGAFIKKQVALMKILVVTGLILLSVSLGLLPLLKGVYMFFAAISAAGIGTGLILPCLNMLITSTTATEERGMVTSLYGSVRFFGVAFGPPVFGWLMNFGQPVMFWSAAALAGAAAAVSFFFIRIKAIKNAPNKHREKEQLKNKRYSGYLAPTPEPARKPLNNHHYKDQVNNGQRNNR
nr:MFS transporter [Desulforadius tongensis]